MLVVRLEIWPFGDHARKREIGVMNIANVAGNDEVSDYAVTIAKDNQPVSGGRVTQHVRADGAWVLVRRALDLLPSTAPAAGVASEGPMRGHKTVTPELRGLGDRVKKARFAKDITAARAARKARIAVGVLQRIENGTTADPSDEVLAKLAAALGVTVGWLRTGSEEK